MKKNTWYYRNRGCSCRCGLYPLTQGGRNQTSSGESAMSYCRHCGSPLEKTDTFCSCCGRRISHGESRHFSAVGEAQTVQKEPLDKLSCELAYSGTLFWLPLLLCSKRSDAKYHANQGLWLLILSVLFCTMIRLLSDINNFFAGSVFGAVTGAIYALAFTVFLFAMLYLAASALLQAFAIHNEQKAKAILFFDKIRIIKY